MLIWFQAPITYSEPSTNSKRCELWWRQSSTRSVKMTQAVYESTNILIWSTRNLKYYGRGHLNGVWYHLDVVSLVELVSVLLHSLNLHLLLIVTCLPVFSLALIFPSEIIAPCFPSSLYIHSFIILLQERNIFIMTAAV